MIEQFKTAAEEPLVKVIDPKWAEDRKVNCAINDGSPISEIIHYVNEE